MKFQPFKQSFPNMFLVNISMYLLKAKNIKSILFAPASIYNTIYSVAYY
jgi:hypothetical protein